MMKYEEFKKQVIERFLDYFGEERNQYEIRTDRIKKINRILDAVIIATTQEGTGTFPTLYVEQMYDDYRTLEDFDKTMEHYVALAKDGMACAPSYAGIETVEGIEKENIVLMLINTNQNEELLATVPHRTYLDLSVIYRMIVDKSDTGIASVTITNQVAEQYQITEEELHELAIANTMRMFPPVIRNMGDVIAEALRSDGMPEELIEIAVGAEGPLFILSSDLSINGSASMYFESVLHDFAEKIESDLYILPSSIHEVILRPTIEDEEEIDPKALGEMVQSVNVEQVNEGERLSNSVYRYNRETRALEIAYMSESALV